VSEPDNVVCEFTHHKIMLFGPAVAQTGRSQNKRKDLGEGSIVQIQSSSEPRISKIHNNT